MSRFDELHLYKNVSDRQKLVIVRGEMLPLITTVKGYAQLIEHQTKTTSGNAVPPELLTWVAKIIEAADDLNKLRAFLLDE